LAADGAFATLSVRLAEDEIDIEAAQALRYRVFYEEMRARPTTDMARYRLDFDAFDPVCDHLLVIDESLGPDVDGVVGTYRLLRGSHAHRVGGFYSAGEFDLPAFGHAPGGLLELGRSCVDARYRHRATMQLLWRGIAEYVFRHEIKLMFGCASLPGTDVDMLAESLSYLRHFHLAPPELRGRARAERYVDMDQLPADDVDPRRAAARLPPLIKGYLRLGGVVGDGAVVDHQFNTTDVLVVVETDQVTDRYYNYYARRARDGEGHA
jgi:putative hemolysin